MIKKLLVTLIAFVTVFFTQSQVWAAANHAETTTQAINVAIDKSTFLASDEAPAMMAKRMGDGGGNSMMWIASIFIAGLGQILMGDLWRGLKFTLLVYGIGIIGVFLSNYSRALYGFIAFIALGVLSLVAYMAAILFYVFNVIDAYNISKEQAGISKLNAEEMAKMEKGLKTVMDFATSVKVSDSGAVSVRALAF